MTRDRRVAESFEAILSAWVSVEGLLAPCSFSKKAHGFATPRRPVFLKLTPRLLTVVQAGPKAGSCGTAAFRKQLVIVADILQDSLWEDYRDLASAMASCVLVHSVFFESGQSSRHFCHVLRSPRRPGPDETQLIDVATRIASIAVERWQGEWERGGSLRATVLS